MEIEKLASQLFEMFPENSINRDFILQNAKMMTIPPHKSIIRLTKTEKHELAYSIEKLKVILFNQANFSISILPDLNYVVEINCIGPNNWSPVERRVIVSPSVGVSVLRGSHVFIAGIIAIEDEFLECTNELKNVSVWIDLEEKCKMGLKKRYEGSVKCIGNGQLTIVSVK